MIGHLPVKVARKVHAYSVVGSVSPVVSELVVNSIKAGASRVKIVFDLESLSLCVFDNGSGFVDFSLDPKSDGLHLSLETISSTCAYLYLLNHREFGDECICIGNPMDHSVFEMYRSRFGISKGHFGTTALVCRLYHDLPVRAKLLRQLSKKEVIRELKNALFFCLVNLLYVQVTISFLNDLPCVVLQPADSVVNLYKETHYQQNVCPVNIENDFINISGFVADAINGNHRFQVVQWNNQFVELTKKEKKTLIELLKDLLPEECRGVRVKSYFIRIIQAPTLKLPMDVFQSLNSLSTKRPASFRRKGNNSPQIRRECINNSPYFGTVSLLGRQAIDGAEVIGQIANQVILIRTGARMFFVDQHACDERFQFELILRRFIERVTDPYYDLRVKLTEPIWFKVNINEYHDLDDYATCFDAMGISYFLDQDICCITHLPYCMRNSIGSDGSDIGASLLSYTSSQKPNVDIQSDNWFLQVLKLPSCIFSSLALSACRQSIKFGQRLNHFELCYLIKNLSNCKLPFQCAHGRPTIISMDIAKLGSFDEDLKL